MIEAFFGGIELAVISIMFFGGVILTLAIIIGIVLLGVFLFDWMSNKLK